jgi:hypothetical protein
VRIKDRERGQGIRNKGERQQTEEKKRKIKPD